MPRDAHGLKGHLELAGVGVIGLLAARPVAVLVHRVAGQVGQGRPHGHAVDAVGRLVGEADAELGGGQCRDRHRLNCSTRPADGDVVDGERGGVDGLGEGHIDVADRRAQGPRRAVARDLRAGEVDDGRAVVDVLARLAAGAVAVLVELVAQRGRDIGADGELVGALGRQRAAQLKAVGRGAKMGDARDRRRLRAGEGHVARGEGRQVDGRREGHVDVVDRGIGQLGQMGERPRTERQSGRGAEPGIVVDPVADGGAVGVGVGDAVGGRGVVGAAGVAPPVVLGRHVARGAAVVVDGLGEVGEGRVGDGGVVAVGDEDPQVARVDADVGQGGRAVLDVDIEAAVVAELSPGEGEGRPRPDVDAPALAVAHDEPRGRRVAVDVEPPRVAAIPGAAVGDLHVFEGCIGAGRVVDLEVGPVAGRGQAPAVVKGVTEDAIVGARGQNDGLRGRAVGIESAFDVEVLIRRELDHDAGVEGQRGRVVDRDAAVGGIGHVDAAQLYGAVEGPALDQNRLVGVVLRRQVDEGGAAVELHVEGVVAGARHAEAVEGRGAPVDGHAAPVALRDRDVGECRRRRDAQRPAVAAAMV